MINTSNPNQAFASVNLNQPTNGGPAFPLPAVSHQGHVVALTEGPALGMTLRDYLAAKALQGMLAAAERGINADIAKYAYKVCRRHAARAR